jgi:cation diffusion facilitator CzcD-associated flavoprotein CzcO
MQITETEQVNTIIVGASAAGLACAVCLQKRNIPFIILEQHDQIAFTWRQHYDRLHLNTGKKQSALPYLSLPKEAPEYVSKDEVIRYFEDYARTFNVSPRFNQEVLSVRHTGLQWEISTKKNKFTARHVIIATGNNRQPFKPTWKGMENFTGTILHSSDYKNGAPFRGKKVLVIGFGNSACEISICLHEHGAFPFMSVKGAVNIVPRGNGSSRLSRLFDSFAFISKLTPALIDSINAPFLRSRYGDYSKLGLKKLPYGPNVQIVKYNRVPLLDIGTIDLIKKGNITVFPGIRQFTANGVQFTDGREETFDAVILGTGYRAAVDQFLPEPADLTDENGRPYSSGVESALPNLYFCGFYSSPLGMLREINREARSIAALIDRKSKQMSSE